MDKHIPSRAIALRPISNYPQHRGRKMMYKTQFNILSYLWFWPMTWVYLHYTVAHSKSFTSVGDYWRERRIGSNCGCIYGPVQTLLRLTSGLSPKCPKPLDRSVCSAMVESTHLGATTSDLTSSHVSVLCFNPYRDQIYVAEFETIFVTAPSFTYEEYSYCSYYL